MIPPATLTRLLWGFGLILVALAAYVCLVPGTDLPKAFEWNDKVSHIMGHAALAAYFSGLVARRSWWKILLALFAFGIAVEILQNTMHAGRMGDPRDVLANTVGVLLGLGLAWLGLSRWTAWAASLLGNRPAAS